METNTNNPAADFDAAIAPFIERARAAIGNGVAVPYAQLEDYWQRQLKDEMNRDGAVIARAQQLLYKDRNDKNKITLVRYALGGAGEAPFDVLLTDISEVQPLVQAETTRRKRSGGGAQVEQAQPHATDNATAVALARDWRATLAELVMATRKMIGNIPRNALDTMARAAADSMRPDLARLGVDVLRGRIEMTADEVASAERMLFDALSAAGKSYLFGAWSQQVFMAGNVAVLRVAVLVRDERSVDHVAAWLDTADHLLALDAGCIPLAIFMTDELERRKQVMRDESEAEGRRAREGAERRQRDEIRREVQLEISKHLARLPEEARRWMELASLFDVNSAERNLCVGIAEMHAGIRKPNHFDEELERKQIEWADKLASKAYPRGVSYADITRRLPPPERGNA